MKLKKSMIIGSTGLSSLGFIRGVNSYKFSHNKYDEKENFLYLNSILYGLLGGFIYVNPIFFPIVIYKETYRLEIYLRNLESEKKTNFYNDIL